MTLDEQLAAYVVGAKYEDLSEQARAELKIRILDALGCAIGALAGPPISRLRLQLEDFGGNPLATLIGGGKTAPDRAALYNSALVRYLDYNDSYIAPGETCHPSDNLGSVLAACEYAHKSGKDLLTALALAYQVQCRLSDVAPVRARGFDHTTQGAYAVAAGVSKALGLDQQKTANAIAISGTAYNALRVTRTGRLSNWKGLAYPDTAFGATHAAFLAMRGITGPLEVFEGNKGFMQSISGPFKIDWESEDLEAVRRTNVKKYNAEFHSQSALEGILELRETQQLSADAVTQIEISIFDVAYNIIGGGEEGNKHLVQTKEEADHSLPYMVAVALLDGEVTPAQYAHERIVKADVQQLLRKVIIRPNETLSKRFPKEMPCHIHVSLNNGQALDLDKTDYEGFYSRPMSWEKACAKFERLTTPSLSAQKRNAIIDATAGLEALDVHDLMTLLGLSLLNA
ncbi:MmgE/PrpD family protein [Ktedonosporobacter rubrisoli]|uniref:MmgE/PrpD family protein n=1 Tax=Ktedonosporobacter rubrisoli TaxID=2509675 RepID=A0A4P6JQX6_KTERU|nr:MmgE/PrpD family protein [Ktedonosporobacter rubrisoli]QBD77590.1 MmgE/PrpD family protein [Ktedonosporobacter rubrisoli]